MRTFFHQAQHQGVFASYRFPGPGQVIPGDQIGQITAREPVDAGLVALAHALPELVESPIGRKRLQHGRQIHLETTLDQGQTFRARQGAEVRVDQFGEQRVAQVAAAELVDVIVELLQQGRHKIHYGAHIRVLFQMRSHVGIILEGMQIGPGQKKNAGFITVIRLVKMPAEYELQHFDLQISGHSPGNRQGA